MDEQEGRFVAAVRGRAETGRQGHQRQRQDYPRRLVTAVRTRRRRKHPWVRRSYACARRRCFNVHISKTPTHPATSAVPARTVNGYLIVGCSITIGSSATASAGGTCRRIERSTAMPHAMLHIAASGALGIAA